MCEVSARTAMWIAVGSYLAAAVGTAVCIGLPHGGGLQGAVTAFLVSGVIWTQRARGSNACMSRFLAQRLAARERDAHRAD